MLLLSNILDNVGMLPKISFSEVLSEFWWFECLFLFLKWNPRDSLESETWRSRLHSSVCFSINWKKLFALICLSVCLDASTGTRCRGRYWTPLTEEPRCPSFWPLSQLSISEFCTEHTRHGPAGHSAQIPQVFSFFTLPQYVSVCALMKTH